MSDQHAKVLGQALICSAKAASDALVPGAAVVK